MTAIPRLSAEGMVTAVALCLAACATTRPAPPTAGAGGTMAPYQVNGVWYRPRADPHYEAVGVATWYGGRYHNRRTADGERFDMDRASAAHPTLPLPCIVEVTNLENGRRIRVRVNDRGPFAPGRVLDLSRQAARDLGFYEKGSARVRVRYVGPASAGDAPALADDRRGLQSASWRAAEPPPAPRPGGIPTRVQAGVFADRGNAERAAGRFGVTGATIEPFDRGGARLWRVVVIGGEGESGAELRARVAAAGFPDARPTPGAAAP